MAIATETTVAHNGRSNRAHSRHFFQTGWSSSLTGSDRVYSSQCAWQYEYDS